MKEYECISAKNQILTLYCFLLYLLMSLSQRSFSPLPSAASERLLPRNKEQKSKGETKYRYGWIHRLIYRNEIYRVNGPESEAFNRRTFQKPIEELQCVTNDNLGFTNRTLYTVEKNKVQLYVPVYLSLKIKSIQEISLRELLARVGCVLIVFVNIENLPKEVIDYLKSNIMVQINRGESFLLAETTETGKITLKQDSKFLTFTIRDTFPVQIYEDVFLSPFEILNLVFSVTFNSTTVKPPKIQSEEKSKEKTNQKIEEKTREKIQEKTFDKKKENTSQRIEKKLEEKEGKVQSKIEQKFKEINEANSSLQKAKKQGKTELKFTISYNSMRHPLKIPITYAEECRLGVYDLAERLLDYYSSNKASYPQVIDEFEDFIEEKENIQKSNCNKKDIEQAKEKKKKDQKADQDLTHEVPYTLSVPESRSQLIMKHSKTEEKKQKKVKYFQYTHFIIPLYKFPGNAWATIFIPMFMLGLLSIFIFLQRTASVTEKLGSIATFVLGFIALIPNIKQELPPSQKISFSEIIVYVESINCMLSLLEQFGGTAKKKLNIWNNPLFLLSITIHVICFASSITLLCLHYFVWEPRYNLKKGQPLSSPKTDYQSWNNPYCDEQFLKFNKSMSKTPADQTKQLKPWSLQIYEKLKQNKPVEEDRVKESQQTTSTFYKARLVKKTV